MKLVGNTLYNILDQFTGEYITFNRGNYKKNGVAISDNDCDDIMYKKVGNQYFKRNYDRLRPEFFGALANGSDDTIKFQKAIDFCFNNSGGEIYMSNTYFVKDLELKKRVHLFGNGKNNCKLRFHKTGFDEVNCFSYVLKWTGSFSSINDLNIDGYGVNGYSVANGLLISPDEQGLERVINNVTVGLFAGYKENRIGGNYGVNANFARTDISDGIGGHLVKGGNAVIIEKNNNAAWNLTVNGLGIFTCDGLGLDCGKVSDSKFVNVDIGQCMNSGIILDQNNKNTQWTNIKVYLCRMLNFKDDFIGRLSSIIPHELSVSSENSAAVVLSGANHLIKNFEIQECGSHGVRLGTSKYSLYNSDLDLLVDGCGGYDKNADVATQLSMQMYGIICVNYFAIKLKAICEDFRGKFLLPRQRRGFHVISQTSRRKFIASSDLSQDNFYRIADNTNADFLPLQLNYTNKSNAVGTVFQARSQYQTPLPIADFGQGWLEPVNGYSHFDLTIVNQSEQNEGGLGYSIDNDFNSSFKINSTIFQKKTYTDLLMSKTGNALVLGCEGANSIIFQQGGITTGQWFSGGLLYIGDSPISTSSKLAVNGSVVVGNVSVNPSSSMLTVNSTNKGLLNPRMTKANRLAIVLPEEGLKVYQIQENGIETEAGEYVYKKTGWTKIV